MRPALVDVEVDVVPDHRHLAQLLGVAQGIVRGDGEQHLARSARQVAGETSVRPISWSYSERPHRRIS